jgi:hypothetical protein
MAHYFAVAGRSGSTDPWGGLEHQAGAAKLERLHFRRQLHAGTI